MTAYQADAESPFKESGFFSHGSSSATDSNAMAAPQQQKHHHQQLEMAEPSLNRRICHHLSETYGTGEQLTHNTPQAPDQHYAMGYNAQPPMPYAQWKGGNQYLGAPPPNPMNHHYNQLMGPAGGYQPLPPPPATPHMQQQQQQQQGWAYNYPMQESPLQSSLWSGPTNVAPSPLMACLQKPSAPLPPPPPPQPAPPSMEQCGEQSASRRCGEGSRPRRKNVTRENTAMLRDWLDGHMEHPYPSKAEKIMLAVVAQMTLSQVSTWFANARRRLRKDQSARIARRGGIGGRGSVSSPNLGQAEGRRDSGYGSNPEGCSGDASRAAHSQGGTTADLILPFCLSEPTLAQAPMSMVQKAALEHQDNDTWIADPMTVPTCPMNAAGYRTPPPFPQSQVGQSYQRIDSIVEQKAPQGLKVESSGMF